MASNYNDGVLTICELKPVKDSDDNWTEKPVELSKHHFRNKSTSTTEHYLAAQSQVEIAKRVIIRRFLQIYEQRSIIKIDNVFYKVQRLYNPPKGNETEISLEVLKIDNKAESEPSA